MNKRLKDIVKNSKLLWFGVSTLIVLMMLYHVDFSRFMAAFSRADVVMLVPGFAAGVSLFGVWAYVWKHFFDEMEMGIGYWKSLKMFMAGHFLNSIFPLGQFGGEPFMAYVISRNTDSSYEKSISAVFSADLVNTIPGFTFMLGGGVFLLLTGSGIARMNQVLGSVIGLTVLLIVIGYLIWFRPEKVKTGIMRAIGFVAGITGLK